MTTESPSIWLLSWSAEAAEMLTSKLDARWTATTTILGRNRGRVVAATGPRRFRGAVAVLESAAFVDDRLNDEFVDGLLWCVRQVEERDDFRLFVWLRDVGLDDLRRDTRLEPLFDTVQLREQIDAAEVALGINTYLKSFDELRSSVWARVAHLWLEGLVSIAGTVLLVSTALLLAASAVFHVAGREPTFVRAAVGADVFGFLVSVPVFPAILLALVLLRGPGFGPGTMLVQFAVVLLLFESLSARSGASNAWILLGLCSGLLADAARRSVGTVRWRILLEQSQRSGSAALRRSLAVLSRVVWYGRSPAIDTRSSSQSAVAGLGGERPSRPLTDPWSGEPLTKVFISYTREKWSSELAERLVDHLRRLPRLEVFLDRQSIEVGSGWLRDLRRRLPEADVLICLVEEATLRKPWPAWELEMALRGRALTGRPEVMLIVETGLPEPLPAGSHPVFVEALRQRHRLVAGVPRVITEHTDTARLLGHAWWGGGMLSHGLLPARVDIVVQSVGHVITFGAVWGSLVGQMLMVVYAMGWQRVVQIEPVLTPAILLSGFWLGFQMRIQVSHFSASPLLAHHQQESAAPLSSLDDVYQAVRHQGQTSLAVSRASATLRMVGAVGLALNVIVLSAYTTHLLVGWAAALGVFGWMLADRMAAWRGGHWKGLGQQRYE